MTWHLEAETVARYDAGLADRITSASVEAHLERCEACRQFVVSDQSWLDQRWAAVAQGVYTPTLTRTEKTLGRLGVPSHFARLLAVTPSLRPAWLIAVAVALLFAALASQSGSERFDPFLMVAPMVPVLAVALAYSRRGDPAHEILVSSPFDPVRVLFLRVAAVTFTAFAIGVVVDLATRGGSGFGLWLLPALGLVAATLALGTRISLWASGLLSLAAWTAFLTIASTRFEWSTTVALGRRTQAGFLLLTLAAGVVLVRRAHHYRTDGL